MKINLICIGKTKSLEILKLMIDIEKRLPNYINYNRIEINDRKNKSSNKIENLRIEKELIENHINISDFNVLLDENGKEFTSVEFSDWLKYKMNNSTKSINFIIGGANGFDNDLKVKYYLLSLSKMTLTHQMVRLFFTEQLYRAFSIIENKPYHNE